MNEICKGLKEQKVEVRISQGILENSIASINDLIRHRETLTCQRSPNVYVTSDATASR